IGATGSASMDDDTLVRVLFQGGISTSETVTGLSGRGVGLDVVRESVARLGGDVSARTSPGKGTTVELVVPLSIAAFQTLVAEVAGAAIAIPLDSVAGTLRVPRLEVVRNGPREAVLFDGQPVPVLSLR